MSEYQYYEFQAVDRSLTKQEMDELRSFSSRARITSHSFINDYSWGRFKGDEDLWMEKYFDAFLYHANWGTHCLKLGIPSAYLDINIVKQYFKDGCFSARVNGNKIILDFLSEEEGGDYWDEDDEDGLHLSSFLKLRTDIIYGDYRCLYLAWLSGIYNDSNDDEYYDSNFDDEEDCDEFDDNADELEPPVPPGLQNLSPALMQFADFLRVDFDLIQAAAKISPSYEEMAPSSNDLKEWIASLSEKEKNNMLLEILESGLKRDQGVFLQQINSFNKIWMPLQNPKKAKAKRRTVRELLTEAKSIRKERMQQRAEKTAKERIEAEMQQLIARERRLNEIKGCENILWNQIETLACEMKAKSYDRALELIVDLRDLSVKENSTGFLSKLIAFKQRHSTKSALIKRLQDVHK